MPLARACSMETVKGEILSIGTELLMGELTDTNSAYIAAHAPALGITIQRMSQVGDDLQLLAGAFAAALERSDVVFSTGGLGPTQDDLTREAISSALGEDMQVDPGLLEDLKAWFRYRGADMPPRNTKQATLIPSAVTIPNNQGTAPGWWVEQKGKIIVAMPGPPGEMYNMWQNQVAPKLGGKVRGQVIITRNIKTTDLAEADVAERVARFAESENPYLGIYAKHDGIHLRIIGRGASEEEARALIEPVESGILEIMGPHVWGFDDDSPEGALAEALSEAGLTVATMESCTGGLMASTITDVPGSSAYFRGGIVSYSNEAKIANGVPAEVIRDHGAISAETAEAMAKAARQRMGADLGVGVTGVAGPSEQEGKAVGTVFIAIAAEGVVKPVALRLPPRRAVVKYRSVTTALVELTRLVQEFGC